MHNLKHENNVTELSPAGYVFKVTPMYMPFDQSHKFARLPCALLQLHHTMTKATILTEERRTNLSAHTVWFSWRQMAGERRAQRLYCCLAPHKYEERTCQRTPHALCPTLHVTNIILMQTTSRTMAMKRAVEKSPTTLRKKRKEALMHFVINNQYQ